ncbi:hypothetical protein VTJ49DRAFT_6126 [Mycothermus thermophilus]|uniref:Mitochondrial import inner membrane translocase subunit TIM50 n=1 Tax=Humicola insolens TaxID=85995 RepID=A0ABR3VMC3_HUMIN
MDQNPPWYWQPPGGYQQPPMPDGYGSYSMPFSAPFNHQGGWDLQASQPPPPPPPPYHGASPMPTYNQGWAGGGGGYDSSGPWGGHQPDQSHTQTSYGHDNFSNQPPTDWNHSQNANQGYGWSATHPPNHIPQQQVDMRGGQAASHLANPAIAPGHGSSKRARRKRRLRLAMEQALQQQQAADHRQPVASHNAALAVGNGPFVPTKPLQQQHQISVAPETNLAPPTATTSLATTNDSPAKKKKKKEKKKKMKQKATTIANSGAAAATTPATTTTQAATTITTTVPSEPHRDPITAPSAASGGIPSPTPSYLSQSSLPPTTLPTPKPLLVVIDLNGTLLHRPNRRTAPSRFIERPGARQFLARCLARHRVVIWSSARPNNVRLMCSQLLSPKQLREVVAVWGRDRFGLSPDDYNKRTQCYKRLSRLWEDPAVASSHPLAREGVRWGQADTVLIDDSAEKARSEPHNAITLPEFVGDQGEKPRVLPLVEAYLDELALQKDVSGYIRVHPFVIM